MEHFGTIPFLRTPNNKKFMVKKEKLLNRFCAIQDLIQDYHNPDMPYWMKK